MEPRGIFIETLQKRINPMGCTVKAFNPGTIYTRKALLILEYYPDLLAHLFFQAIIDTIEEISSKAYTYKLSYQFLQNDTIGVTINFTARSL